MRGPRGRRSGPDVPGEVHPSGGRPGRKPGPRRQTAYSAVDPLPFREWWPQLRHVCTDEARCQDCRCYLGLLDRDDPDEMGNHDCCLNGLRVDELERVQIGIYQACGQQVTDEQM